MKPPGLLFGVMFVTWQAANYLFTHYPGREDRTERRAGKVVASILIRSAVAGGIVLAAAGWWPGLRLAAWTSACCVALPMARWRWVPTRYGAELELLGNLLFAAVAHWLISKLGLPALTAAVGGQLTAYLIAAGVLIFVVQGGTYIVRGVLERAGTMPPATLDSTPPAAAGGELELRGALPVNTVELNHGRLIGNVERIILVLFVANGQYTALAFFFAAKGLIRSKDVERRAWADYLILGSLTSFLVAVVAGLMIQAMFEAVSK